MRTETRTVRVGENVGAVDWEHPTAKDMPPVWREAEANPDGFYLDQGSGGRAIYALCMYDGWPYWTPRPAILHASPIGGSEWSFFDSYGIYPDIIQRRGEDCQAGAA